MKSKNYITLICAIMIIFFLLGSFAEGTVQLPVLSQYNPFSGKLQYSWYINDSFELYSSSGFLRVNTSNFADTCNIATQQSIYNGTHFVCGADAGGTVTVWNLTGSNYLINNSNILDWNETKGNNTYFNINVNESTTGNINMTTADIFIQDEANEERSMKKQNQHMDSLQDDMALDKITKSITTTGGVTNITITHADGFNIDVNLDRVNYNIGSSSMTVALTSGTDLIPQINYITIYLVGNTPTLNSDTSHPTVEHIDVQTLEIKANGVVASYFPNSYFSYELLNKLVDRFEDSGSLYLSGFATTVSATQLNMSTGNMKLVLEKIECNNNMTMLGGYTYVNSSGSWVSGTDLSTLTEYSDGTAIGIGEWGNVVWNACALNKTTCQLVGVVQNYPGVGNEYTSCKKAQDDKKTTKNFFTADANLKKTCTPIAHTLVDFDLNQFCEFDPPGSNIWVKFLGGKVTSGGGAPSAVSTPWTNTATDIIQVDTTLNVTISQYLTVGQTIYGTLIWGNLSNYPAACPAGTFVTTIGDSTTCTAPTAADVDPGTFPTGDYIFTGGTLDADTLNTGQGDYELYAMNQNVLITSDVIYNNVNVTTNISINGGTISYNGSAWIFS